MDENDLPDFEDLKENFEMVHKLINEGKVLSIASVRNGGLADVLTKACMGNKLGFKAMSNVNYFELMYGSFVMELSEDVENSKFVELGTTCDCGKIVIGNVEMPIEELIKVWQEPLEKVFPTKVKNEKAKVENIVSDKTCTIKCTKPIAKPRVFIPVFPGTNCEYDVTKAFEDAGAIVNTSVFKNIKSNDITDSIEEFAKQINQAQIIMLPGGFSAGDEPDGSGKFIATVFRNPKLRDLIHSHLYEKDGLMLGICNGFQALVKTGLLPYGKIIDMTSEMPTLTFNQIARHQSCMVQTKVTSKMSPWFSKVNLGDVFTIPISHGEGRFVVNEQVYKDLAENGQIATQYVDFEGNASMEIEFNPNGSNYAIECITSPDGRIMGKMGHSERSYTDIYKNMPGEKDQKLFEAGVTYFS